MPGFPCQIRTENSFLNFNIINHPTFSISELRNLHVYNGGFEKKDKNANAAQTGRFSETDKQSTSAPVTVTFLSSSQRLSARDFEKTKHNLRIENEGS